MNKRDIIKLKSIIYSKAPTPNTYNLQPTTYSKAFTIVELLVVIVVIGILDLIYKVNYFFVFFSSHVYFLYQQTMDRSLVRSTTQLGL
jgi:prepilin-type N-terminal cleavage/methylation domain-containing protein